jgi:hypothetical protein
MGVRNDTYPGSSLAHGMPDIYQDLNSLPIRLARHAAR